MQVQRVPAAPAAAAVAAKFDRSLVAIDFVPDVMMASDASKTPSTTISVTISDAEVTHIGWILYDPADKHESADSSTLATDADAKTRSYTLKPGAFAGAGQQGRYRLRCLGYNSKNEPVVYADRTFFVWKTKPMAGKELGDLKAIIKDPSKASLGEVGAAYGRSMLLEHREAVAKTGTGKYQGQQCSTAAPGGVKLEDCTSYVWEVLGETFGAKGKGDTWTAVAKEAKKLSGSALKGTDLLTALESKAGWKAVFWSPDPKNPQDKTSEHPVAYKAVKSKGEYYKIGVDKAKSVVDYRPTSASKVEDMSNLDRLRQVPMAVIAAHGGLHMTLLINAQVYEVHWDKPPSDPDVIQATPLENWEWQSGVVVMPAEDFDRVFKP